MAIFHFFKRKIQKDITHPEMQSKASKEGREYGDIPSFYLILGKVSFYSLVMYNEVRKLPSI